MRNKKAQVTIFVIIALIIVTTIALIFIFLNGSLVKSSISAKENPQAYIQNCIEESLEDTIHLILKNSGYIKEQEGILYDGKKAAYLCYAKEKEELCVNKEPILKGRIEKEVYNYVRPRIEQCFVMLKQELKENNYQEGDLFMEVEIISQKIIIKINRDISYEDKGQLIEVKTFDGSYSTSLYDFTRLTNEIINQELTCECGTTSCNADIVKLSIQNKDYEIEKFVTSKNEEVYTIRNAITMEEFRFAIKNCILLP